MDIPQTDEIIRHSKLLFESYKSKTGLDLLHEIPSNQELSVILYHAPFALLSHGTERDPIFNYANKTAQRLWELSWKDFITMPSRLSAEPTQENNRNKLLSEAQKRGFVTGYEGVRISHSGKRFLIKNTTLWNITGEDGVFKGQAALFTAWEFL